MGPYCSYGEAATWPISTIQVEVPNLGNEYRNQASWKYLTYTCILTESYNSIH